VAGLRRGRRDPGTGGRPGAAADGGELARTGIVDEVLPEPTGGAHEDPLRTYDVVRRALRRHLGQLLEQPAEVVLKERYRRLRSIGSMRDPAERGEVTQPERAREAGQW
jgi:hypothetical protein